MHDAEGFDVGRHRKRYGGPRKAFGSDVSEHRVIPLYKRGNRLSVATADPTNLRALDEIRFQTGLIVDPIIVREDQLTPLAAKLAESADTTLKNLVSESIHLEFDEDQAGEPAPEDDADVEDAPIVRSSKIGRASCRERV